MHPRHETLNDYVDGVLDASAHADVDHHVQRCADCALLVAELQHIIGEAAALASIEPPARVWNEVLARLDERSGALTGQRAEGQGRRAESRGHRAESRGHRAESKEHRVWNTHPAWALATAALVVVAFLAGRVIEQRQHRDQLQQAASPVKQPAAADANVRERVLLVAVGDHLERSQMVLVELANAQTRGELDISAERQWADELLASNRLYRQTAVQMGETSVASVLDDLERVLVEVARGPSQVSMQQLAEIQRRIEAQGLLFKVKIIGSDVRERGTPTITERKPPVS